MSGRRCSPVWCPPTPTGQTRAGSTRPSRATRSPSCGRTGPGACAHALAVFPFHALHGLVKGIEVPKVLDLEGIGVTLQLTGKAVELEVFLCYLASPTVLREQSFLGALLVVGQELLLQLGRDVGEKAQTFTLLGNERGVFIDRAPHGQYLFEQDLNGLLVLLEPLDVAEHRLVAGVDLGNREFVESAGFLAHHEVPVGDVEDGGRHVSTQERRSPHFRTGHVADLAELDALGLFNEPSQRLRGGAARVNCERLTVERLPVGVRRHVGDREEACDLQLAEDPYGGGGALDQTVRGTEPDIGLPADDRLVGEILVGQLVELDLDITFAHPVERDEQGERLDRLDVTQRDADGSRILLCRARTVIISTCGQEKSKCRQDGQELFHRHHLSGRLPILWIIYRPPWGKLLLCSPASEGCATRRRGDRFQPWPLRDSQARTRTDGS